MIDFAATSKFSFKPVLLLKYWIKELWFTLECGNQLIWYSDEEPSLAMSGANLTELADCYSLIVPQFVG